MGWFSDKFPEIAKAVLGEPNKLHSKSNDLRWGTHGSQSVHRSKGSWVWYDFENNIGGGVLDFLREHKGLVNGMALAWIRSEFGLEPPANDNFSRRDGANVRIYDYVNEDGEVTLQVVRTQLENGSKSFKQRQPKGAGYQWDTKGWTPIPYRLLDIINPDKLNRIVFVVEGEKCADILAKKCGVVTTTNAQGSKKFQPEIAKYFEGRKVIILPDNDKPGYAHARHVWDILKPVAGEIRFLPLPGVKDKGDIADWLEDHKPDELKALVLEAFRGPELEPVIEDDLPEGDGIAARRFKYKPPSEIKPRDWIYGRHLIRKFVSVTIAPGGVGKSSLVFAEAAAMATGVPVMGVPIGTPKKVWLLNLEDPMDEMERRMGAIIQHYELDHRMLEQNMWMNSGRDTPLTLAEENRLEGGGILIRPDFDQVIDEIKTHKIDVMVVDPFVSSHMVNENDNTQIDAVTKLWGRIADEGNCAIELVHHTRKLQSGEKTTAESARGAKAMTDAARDVRVLQRMSEDEAAKYGVKNHRLHIQYFSDKGNLAPPAEYADWFVLKSIDLNNATIGESDHVGVPVPWEMPGPLTDISMNAIDTVLRSIEAGTPEGQFSRRNIKGRSAIGEIMELLDVEEERARLILHVWIESGVIVDRGGKDGLTVDKGKWAEMRNPK